jgi:signal transduction histidine kinase
LIPFVADRGHNLRTLTRTIQANGETYSVSMAISADSSVLILKHFRSDLLLMVPVVLLAAAVVGHFLSRKALDPVTAIVTDVRRINDRNLATRLPVPKTHDELSLLSETVNHMLERIDSAFRSVRSLTANASHELRTPLSLIRTRVEIALCFPRTNEQYRAILEEVESETLRMTTLIENLLTIARNDAGASQTELKPLDLMPLMKRAFREWAPTAERLSLQFDFDAGSEPLWILGNSESLERVIRALIDNACRYTPPGKWIRLNCSVSEENVTISVDDGGIGITADDLPHIFERFYRSSPPQHGQQPGSGLGLSLVKWIVDQHRASIVVDSSVGEGSSFRVVFPRHIEVLKPTDVSLV